MNIENLRMERWERIKKEGPLKFVFKNGFLFALIFGLFVFFFSKPPIPNYILIFLILAGGLFFGIGAWFIQMRQYNKTLEKRIKR